MINNFTKKYIVFLSIFFAVNVFASNPSQPFLPSDNILDPLCSPTDSNCYVLLTSFTNEDVEGLDYSTTTGLLSLTSGFEIPTIASTTEWANKVSSLWFNDSSGNYSYDGGNVLVNGSSVALVNNSNYITDFYGNNLKVSSSDFADFAYFANNNIGDFFQNNLNANNNILTGLSTGSVSAPSLSFFNDSDTGIFSPEADTLAFVEGGVEVMRINSSGNVGIGTTTPLSRFSVVGTSTFMGGNLGIGTTNPSALFSVGSASNFQIDSSGGIARISGLSGTAINNSGGFLSMSYNASAVRVANSGLVALVRNGLEKLVVNSSGITLNDLNIQASDNDSVLRFTNVAGGTAVNYPLLTNALTGGNITYGVDGTDTNIGINLTPKGTGNVIFTSGNVGIGTTTPADRLQVFGDIRMGTTGTNGCIKNFAGTGIQGTCSSDERLKTNIVDFSDGYLDKLVNLKLITYNWNEEANTLNKVDTTVTNYGLLAQNVESIFPELVSTDSKGYKQVDYSRLPLYILKSVQELAKRVVGFAEEFRTQKLCVGDTCIDENQLKILLQNQNTQNIVTQTVTAVQSNNTESDNTTNAITESNTDNTENNSVQNTSEENVITESTIIEATTEIPTEIPTETPTVTTSE